MRPLQHLSVWLPINACDPSPGLEAAVVLGARKMNKWLQIHHAIGHLKHMSATTHTLCKLRARIARLPIIDRTDGQDSLAASPRAKGIHKNLQHPLAPGFVLLQLQAAVVSVEESPPVEPMKCKPAAVIRWAVGHGGVRGKHLLPPPVQGVWVVKPPAWGWM